MAKIELRNIAKRYGPVEIINNINVEFEDGEFIVLVGPSGCGKSTLLRMIAGLEPVSGGEIIIDDVTVNNMPPRDRDIAMVFQSYALYPHMDVSRNMGFGLEIRKESTDYRRSRVGKAADTLGLQPLLDRLPKALSGGQRQRVAMGRAIVRDPKAFLFDEPLSNLDAALRVEMRLEIAKLHHRLKSTMVYVTHDQVEALTLADRIVVMKGGDIQQVGTPMQLYNSPTNLFVAQFIGSPTMNVFKARTKAQDGEKDKTNSRDIVLENGAVLSHHSEQDIQQIDHYGIRPEHIDIIKICSDETADVNGIAEVVERLGSESNIYVQVPELGHILIKYRDDVDIKVGDEIGLKFQRDRAHLFADSGETRLN